MYKQEEGQDSGGASICCRFFPIWVSTLYCVVFVLNFLSIFPDLSLHPTFSFGLYCLFISTEELWACHCSDIFKSKLKAKARWSLCNETWQKRPTRVCFEFCFELWEMSLEARWHRLYIFQGLKQSSKPQLVGLFSLYRGKRDLQALVPIFANSFGKLHWRCVCAFSLWIELNPRTPGNKRPRLGTADATIFELRLPVRGSNLLLSRTFCLVPFIHELFFSIFSSYRLFGVLPWRRLGELPDIVGAKVGDQVCRHLRLGWNVWAFLYSSIYFIHVCIYIHINHFTHTHIWSIQWFVTFITEVLCRAEDREIRGISWRSEIRGSISSDRCIV